MSSLYKLDLFRTLPTKMSEQTVLGSFLTLAVVGFFLYAMIFEFDHIFHDPVKSQIEFKDHHLKDIRIDLSIDFFRLPCEFVAVQIPSSGSHSQDFTYNRKIVHEVDMGLGLITNFKHPVVEEHKNTRELDEILEALKKGEGCEISGSMYKNFLMNTIWFVPNNEYLAGQVSEKNKTFRMDFSHVINHLMMGDFEKYRKYAQEFGLDSEAVSLKSAALAGQVIDENKGLDHPLPNVESSLRRHIYSLKAVPLYFEGYFGETDLYQGSTSYYQQRGVASGLILSAELTAVSVRYWRNGSSGLFYTLMQIFSMFGGVFMIFKVCDGILTRVLVKEKKYTEVDTGSELM